MRQVDEEILLMLARRSGIEVPDEDLMREVQRAERGYPDGEMERVLLAEQLPVPTYIERVLRRMTIERYLLQALSESIEVTGEEVQARYDAEPRVRPREVRARQVLVRTREEADSIQADIKSRKITLAEAARRYSESPERTDGGDLGWFARGDLPSVFDACFALPIGRPSDVVASAYGFHLFEVIDVHDGGQEPFANAAPRIERDIRREKEEAAMSSALAASRGLARVQIDEAVFQGVLELTRSLAAGTTPNAPAMTGQRNASGPKAGG
jgi:parvulin-like peptidyl-prolyl isomerase